jgi:hypothetical protein
MGFADDPVIRQDKEDAEYMTKKINRRISDMGFKCP